MLTSSIYPKHPTNPPKIIFENITLALADSSEPIRKEEAIYPLIFTSVNNVPMNIMIDSGSASSHATEAIVRATASNVQQREVPLQVIGFGNTRSRLITEYSEIKLTGKRGETAVIKFNIFKRDLITDLPEVSSAAFDEFPHLLQHRKMLAAPIPRGPTKVDAIIGVKDMVKVYLRNRPTSDSCDEICIMSRADCMDSAIEARQTIFGTVLTGGIGQCMENKDDDEDKENMHVVRKPISRNLYKIDECEEITLSSREIPLDILLRKTIGIDDTDLDVPEDKSTLQKEAYKNFISNVQVKPTKCEGVYRFSIKLTRLPEYLYPIRVDGRKISGQAVSRFHALENRLNHNRNKKLREGVHERINSLIKDDMMKLVGLGKKTNPNFCKTRNQAMRTFFYLVQ